MWLHISRITQDFPCRILSCHSSASWAHSGPRSGASTDYSLFTVWPPMGCYVHTWSSFCSCVCSSSIPGGNTRWAGR